MSRRCSTISFRSCEILRAVSLPSAIIGNTLPFVIGIGAAAAAHRRPRTRGGIAGSPWGGDSVVSTPDGRGFPRGDLRPAVQTCRICTEKSEKVPLRGMWATRDSQDHSGRGAKGAAHTVAVQNDYGFCRTGRRVLPPAFEISLQHPDPAAGCCRSRSSYRWHRSRLLRSRMFDAERAGPTSPSPIMSATDSRPA